MTTKNIKSFFDSATPKELVIAVKAAGGTLGPKLTEASNKATSSFWMIVVLGIATVACMIASGYYSIIGSNFMFSGASAVSMIFSALSFALLYVVLQRRFGYLPLAFGGVCALWAAFMIPGYFGQEGLRVSAQNQVSLMRTEAEQTYYKDILALNSMTENMAITGASVAFIEEHRDIKGTVAEKGALIEQMMRPIEVPEFPAPVDDSLVPKFKSLPEANKWVQDQTSLLNTNMAKMQSISSGLIQKAQGAASGLDTLLKTGTLSPQQKSNLSSLTEALHQIGNYKLSTPKLEARTLSSSDLRTGVEHWVIGGLIEIVIELLLFMLIRAQMNSFSMDELQKEAAFRGLSKLFQDWSIPCGKLETANFDYQVLENLAARLEQDEQLREWFKKNSDFNAAMQLEQKHPGALDLLKSGKAGSSGMKRLEKLIKDYPDMGADYAAILELGDAKWNALVAVIPAHRVLELLANKELLGKLQFVIDAGKTRFGVRTEAMKAFFDRMLVDDMNEPYLETLLVFIQQLDEERLALITPHFVSVLDAEVATFIVRCTMKQTFQQVVNEWTPIDTAEAKTILSNGVAAKTDFATFFKTVFSTLAMPGFRKAADAYAEAGREVELGSDDNPLEIVFNSDATKALKDAHCKQNAKPELLDEVAKAFSVKAKEA